MAVYETGTATGPADLIAKLEAFAVANGWTVSTPASGKVFAKGGIYFGLNWGTDDVWVCGATGYSAGSAWSAQPGASASQCRSNDMPGPFQAYHFFTGTAPDYLHVVVEKTSGVFKHFVFGQMIKHGSYVGGEYIGAVYWHMTVIPPSVTPNYPNNNYHCVPFDAGGQLTPAVNRGAVRADIDGKTNNWMLFNYVHNYSGNQAKGVVRPGSILESLHERSPSEFNQLTPLLPMLIGVERGSGLVSPAGYVPDIRYVNMTNFEPAELVTIGSDEWLVFPLIQKTATWDIPYSTVPSSGTFGFAYKRN